MAKGKRKRPRGDAPKPPQANDRPATDKASVRPLLLVVAGLILSGAVAFLLFGGGSDEEETTSAAETEVAELAVPWLDPDRVPPVVGAIDVNPADDSVWFATNTGCSVFPLTAGTRRRSPGR
jgi:hypothetical protein